MNNHVLGFDPSLTSSGFAYYDEDGQIHTGRIRPKKLREIERLQFISNAFTELLDGLRSDDGKRLVAYEGYAMGSQRGPNRAYSTGELGGVLKLLAYRTGIDILLVPPKTLKKYATGDGNAEKEDIIRAVADWGYNVPHNDEADAFALMKMGIDYRATKPSRVKHRREALAKCHLIST